MSTADIITDIITTVTITIITAPSAWQS